MIGGDEETAGADALGEGAADAEAVIEGDESAVAGLDPFDHIVVLAGIGHEEPSAAVSLENEAHQLLVGAKRAVGRRGRLGLVGVDGHGAIITQRGVERNGETRCFGRELCDTEGAEKGAVGFRRSDGVDGEAERDGLWLGRTYGTAGAGG